MALINCSECQREVSDKANACPSCGNPILTNTLNGLRPDSAGGNVRISHKHNELSIALKARQQNLLGEGIARSVELIVNGIVVEEWIGQVTLKTITLETEIDNTRIKATWSGAVGTTKLFINGDLVAKSGVY